MAVHKTFNPDYFVQLSTLEDRHFWFRARNLTISALVKNLVLNLSPDSRILEIGCGTGNVLRVLEQIYSEYVVIGMDLFTDGLHYARQRTSCPLVQGDIYASPFKTQFNLIGLFDVLEHIPDDRGVLCQLHPLLATGGALLLTVPAHPSLWSYFDKISHHCRRYKPAELEDKLINTGYQVEYLSQYMASIFPLVWIGRRLVSLLDRFSNRKSTRAHDLSVSDLRIIPIINELLTFLLTQEVHLIARQHRLPIGTALIAIARKVE